MNDLVEDETFCIGLAVGISLYQRAIVSAHERKKPLIVGENLYYLETGRERLERVLYEICR